MLHSVCQQIWKTHQWPQVWKRSVFIPIPKKGSDKECSNYYTMHSFCMLFKVKKWKSFSCVWLFNPGKDPGILQARILEWVAYPFSSRSFWPRNQTQVSCIAGRFFINWATREAPMLVKVMLILQAGLQQCESQDLQIYKLSLEKAEGWWDDLRE